NGVHADQRVTTHDTAVQNRTVTDVAFLLDHGVGLRKTVHDAAILNVGARAHFDPPEIAAQRCRGPDVTSRSDDDVTDQHCARMHECSGIDHRRGSVDGEHFQAHATSAPAAINRPIRGHCETCASMASPPSTVRGATTSAPSETRARGAASEWKSARPA